MTNSLDALRLQAKKLHRQFETGQSEAIARVNLVNPRRGDLKRADFLHVIARENHFASWPQLKEAVQTQGFDRAAKQQRLKIALFQGQAHVVRQLMWDTPDLAAGAFALQVALYDLEAVQQKLSQDPSAATRVYGPRRPILHLSFSKALQLWPEREADMLAIAEALVEHGADVNDGFREAPGSDHKLSALYGALGHAGNMPLARWLVHQGADPNDGECLYHATELGHCDGLALVLEAGARPNGTNALKRAIDFDNPSMVRMLLEAGADPNEDHGNTALHHAVQRGASAQVLRLLLDAGADQSINRDGVTAYSVAQVYGARKLLPLLDPQPLSPIEKQLAQAAAGTAVPKDYIDPDKLPPAYVNILEDVLHKDDDLAHVKALIAMGMPWDTPNGGGLPPVQIAGWEGLPEALGYFLSLKPDLSHVNNYGGTLLGTIIHGSENNPKRAQRDYIGCLRLALEAGMALHHKAADLAGEPTVKEFLGNWAREHPGQVVHSGTV